MGTLGQMVIASFLSKSRTQNTRGLEHRGMGIRAAIWGAGSGSLTMGIKTPVTLTCPLESQVSIFEEGQHLFLWSEEVFAGLQSIHPLPKCSVLCYGFPVFRKNMRFPAS